MLSEDFRIAYAYLDFSGEKRFVETLLFLVPIFPELFYSASHRHMFRLHK